jgi:NADH dehydrogenase FAD-containing subunit
MRHVVILGGGYAGLHAFSTLARDFAPSSRVVKSS